jgi:hypothetical protein
MPTVRSVVVPTIITQAVATPGTREALAATSTHATYLMLEARRVDGVNIGNVYFGTSAVDKDASQQIVMEPGDTYELNPADGYAFDLDGFYVDADTATDGVTGWYFARA